MVLVSDAVELTELQDAGAEAKAPLLEGTGPPLRDAAFFTHRVSWWDSRSSTATVSETGCSPYSDAHVACTRRKIQHRLLKGWCAPGPLLDRRPGVLLDRPVEQM